MFERILVACGIGVCIARGAPPPPLHAREFVENSALLAHAPQTIIFEAQTVDSSEQAARYELPSGEHKFCLLGNQAYFTGMILENAGGQTIFETSIDQRCTTATLPEGVYTLRLLYASSPAPDPSETAYIQVDLPGPTLLNSNGGPAGGYWAIQPDPAIDPQHRPGRLRAPPPLKNLGTDPGGGFSHSIAAPIVADFSSQGMDEYSLFLFPDGRGHLPFLSALPLVGNDLQNGPWWDVFFIGIDNLTFLVNMHSACDAGCIIPYDDMGMQDLGDYRFNLFYFSKPNLGLSFAADGFSDHTLMTSSQNSPATLRVMFRFFPDGTHVGDLQEGEAAIFQGAGFTGKAAVFGPGTDQNLTALNSPATTIDNTTQSVRLGNNTALLLYRPNMGTTGLVAVMSDAIDPDDDRIFSAFPVSGPMQVVPIPSVLGNSDIAFAYDCSGCKLAGATIAGTPNERLQFLVHDFSNAHFEHATFSYADLDAATLPGAHFDGATLNSLRFTSQTQLANAEFIGATLTNVVFAGANLQHVNFSGATLSNMDLSATTIDSTTNLSGTTLSCISLHGSDSDHLLDLSQSLTNVKWVPGSSCSNNLSYTKLSIKQVPPSVWKGTNLTGAVFVDLEDGQQLSSQAQPLDLTSAQLAGVALENVVLDYAVMKGADLQQAKLNNSSLQSVDLRNAQLQGATLDHVNLDGAVMQGAFLSGGGLAASFEGAFLRNVNLAKAQLGGVSFTNASFYSVTLGTGSCAIDPNTGITASCATAAGATIDNAAFDNAFLFGVDFTSATGQGATFSNAVVVGANFNGATLTGDPKDDQRPGFAGAFLEGTNLAAAASLINLTLDGAYVDFLQGGNTLTLLLDNKHTAFPGYWNAPGAPVCARMAYNNPNTVPARNGTIICPNGNSSSHGCGPAKVDGSNPNWQSDAPFPSNATYKNNSTYTNAPANGQQACQFDVCWSLGICSASGATNGHR